MSTITTPQLPIEEDLLLDLGLNAAELGRLLELAGQFFDDVVSVEIESDPEIPGMRYVLISVNASGEVSDVVDRRMEWLEEVGSILGEREHLVGLTVNIVS